MNAHAGVPLRLRGSLDFLQCLWRTSHALERRSRRMEKAIGLTAPQRLVLRVLGRFPGMTAGQLARALHVDPGTLSASVRRLEARGLVERRRDPVDTRRVTLGLTRQGRALDKVASAVAIVGVSVPHYWAGIILIIVFSVQLNWLPAMGAADGGGPLEYLRHMALPTVALSLIPLGVITRVVRSAALDILNQEFVLALRAKGLAARRVFRHVVKNAAPQIFTVLGLQFGFQLGGSVLVEAVFSWPGTGYLLNLAIFQRDIPVLQGVILVLATFFVLLNLAVDLLQTVVDPRIARH